MKSVGTVGSGSGSQRSCVGGVATSSNGEVFKSGAGSGRKTPCATAGRRRYSQERRLACLGAVNAVPENCSA